MRIIKKIFSFLLIWGFSCGVVVAESDFETTLSKLEDNTETGVLSVVTNVENVEVYINNMYKGVSPLIVEKMTPGMYVINLVKKGYKEKTAFIEVEAGIQSKLFFDLEPLLGFLKITSNVKDADIYINDLLLENIHQFTDSDLIQTPNSFDTGIIKIPEGIYTIEFKKFGYEPKVCNVVVLYDLLSSLNVELEKSLLEITSIKTDPNSFNPNLPQALGKTNVNIGVTTPCIAYFEVFDKNNTLVYVSAEKKLQDSIASLSWNGTNSYNMAEEQGLYSIVVTVKPLAGWNLKGSNSEQENALVVKTTAFIDNNIFYPLVGANSGGTSTGIPTPRLMPKGTTLFSVSGMSNFSLDSGYNATPFSFDIVHNPLADLELAFRVGFETRKSGDIPMFIGGSVKYAVPLYPFFVGGLLRYTYSAEEVFVPVFSEPGLGAGLIGGIEVGNYLFSLSEEVVFGAKTGNVAEFDGHLKTGLSVQYQKDNFSSNTWTALYSSFDLEKMDLMGFIESGLDFSYLLPNTSVSPTVGVNYCYSYNHEHNLAIRFGLNILMP